MKQTGPDERQRWESYVSKRMAEDAPEQKIVEELVGKGADVHLARDFVRRIADSQPREKAVAAEAPKPALKMASGDIILGIVLAVAGLVITLLMYVLDQRSWIVYLGFAATFIGMVIIGRRAWQARS